MDPPTLLGAAFRSRDVSKARELAERIDEKGVDGWKLGATIADLQDAVDRAGETREGQALRKVCEELKDLLEEVSR